jgi:thiosulfate/3-mercaptopyruvate sulfurtransferase
MKFTRRRAKLGFMEFRTLIGVDSLQNLLGKPRLVLLDCRFDLLKPDAGRQAYLSAHIPGALYADLNLDLSAPVGPATGRHPLPRPDALTRRLGELGVGNDSQVVAYDEANGSFAARAWWLLRWLGHDAVAVLDGGFKAWLAHGGTLESGAGAPLPQAQARPFMPRVAAAAAMSVAVLSTAELEQALLKPQALLVDARAPERYAGVVEPIDRVAGHIPGAVNHPFSANLDADGGFLPAAELRARWLERLGGKDPRNLIAMCGSGVTACHNLLGLEVAGLPGAKLYAGSWSEWIRDPRRAVARGNLP